jgi:PAS domain S-box-containing protein
MIEESTAAPDSYAELYEDAPCGYLSLQPDGQIIRANRSLLAMTGYCTDELAGKHFAALLTMPGALLYETYCVPLLRLRGSIGEIALDLLSRDGKSVPILLSAVAKQDQSGAFVRFRVVVLSAPTRREYERELVRARTLADEAKEELRRQRELAERKVAEQDVLLQAVARMAAGDLDSPVPVEAGSWLEPLASGLQRMRQDLLRQIREMKERNAEIEQLNRELRHQIERRSGLLVESMLSQMDDGTVEPVPIFPLGTLLARRYRIGELLGQGAMGTVYQVERLADGRHFAAKVLSIKPDYQAMARFAREAQLLARLQHPNLISIVDADFTQDRIAYIIMELGSGKSLAECSARYKDREFLLPVLDQIAQALAAVHAAGVVHRDLKPANVLISISADGTSAHAKLVDFGVSRLLDSPADPPAVRRAPVVEGGVPGAPRISGQELTIDQPPPAAPVAPVAALSAAEALESTLDGIARPAKAAAGDADGVAIPPPADTSDKTGRRRPSSDKLTQAGALLGTLLYMAPELRSGANLAHPHSDLFSFGVMAYEVLGGTLPFAELPLFRGQDHASGPGIKPLDSLCPGLPPELARMLERCLAAEPTSRPTASELATILGASAGPR